MSATSDPPTDRLLDRSRAITGPRRTRGPAAAVHDPPRSDPARGAAADPARQGRPRRAGRTAISRSRVCSCPAKLLDRDRTTTGRSVERGLGCLRRTAGRQLLRSRWGPLAMRAASAARRRGLRLAAADLFETDILSELAVGSARPTTAAGKDNASAGRHRRGAAGPEHFAGYFRIPAGLRQRFPEVARGCYFIYSRRGVSSNGRIIRELVELDCDVHGFSCFLQHAPGERHPAGPAPAPAAPSTLSAAPAHEPAAGLHCADTAAVVAADSDGQITFAAYLHQLLTGEPDFGHVPGINSRTAGDLITTAGADRIKDSDEVPSPFAAGSSTAPTTVSPS